MNTLHSLAEAVVAWVLWIYDRYQWWQHDREARERRKHYARIGYGSRRVQGRFR